MSLDLQFSVTQTPGDTRVPTRLSQIQDTIAQTSDSSQLAVQTVGTSWEAITIHADITTPGYVFIQNMDATNYVELDVEATGANAVIKLKPGEWAVFRMAATTLYGLANTAACDVQYLVYAD